MAAIDYGTGPNTTTGDTIPVALGKLRDRLIAAGFDPGLGDAATIAVAVRRIETALDVAEAAYVPPLPGTPTPTPTPAPVFTVQPSISPASGVAGATFTATDGSANNTTGYTRRWLLNGTSIGTGSTVVPVTAGALSLEVTATGPGGSTIATSAAVTVTSTPTPTPAFVTNPSISPTSGDANTTFTGTNGTMNNGGTVLSRRWLLDNSAIGTGSSVVPSVAGSLVLENTGTGGVVARSTAVTVSAVAPMLDALSVSPNSAVNGTAYSGTVVGRTADSTLSLSGAGAAGLSINSVTGAISGTPTANGAVNIVETLAGAANSPRTTASAVTVAATATLNALSAVPATSTVNTPYNGTVSGKTAGSTLSLTGPGAAGLSVSGATISGTPTATGAVNVVETLSGATNSPRTTPNAVAVATAQAAPLKSALLQNRLASASDSGGGTRTNCGFRWPCIIACDQSHLVVDLHATFIADYNGTGVPGYELLSCSLEDSVTGTVVPVTYSGARNVNVPGGAARVASDEIPASAFGLTQFPPGRVFNVKGVIRTAAAGNVLPLSQRTTSDGGGAQVWWFDPTVTTLSSVDASGAFTSTGTAVNAVRNGFCPILRGRHVRPVTTFLGLGDSIMEITADSSNNFYGRAFFQRAMHDGTGASNSLRPSILCARVGIQTDGLTRSNFWKAYLDAIDVVISEPLTNDLGTAGGPASAMQQLLSDLYAQITPYGKAIYQTNWTPRTTSSGTWSTQADQTPRASWVTGGVRDQVIAWLDTKVADGTLAGVIDTLSSVQFPGGNGLPADNSRWDTFAPGTTTEGTRITSDGTHPYGSAMERMAGKVRQVIAKYPINGL